MSHYVMVVVDGVAGEAQSLGEAWKEVFARGLFQHLPGGGRRLSSGVTVEVVPGQADIILQPWPDDDARAGG